MNGPIGGIDYPQTYQEFRDWFVDDASCLDYLEGAEAMLKLWAVRSNGDWEAYWKYHLAQEHQRVHRSRYAEGIIPEVA